MHSIQVFKDYYQNMVRVNKRPLVICLNGWYRFGFQSFNWYGSGADVTENAGSSNLLEDMRQEILIDTMEMFNSTSPVVQLSRPPSELKDQIQHFIIHYKFLRHQFNSI